MPEPTFARGAIIGRYVVLERIGSGGMAIVLAAYDPQLDRRVALKLLRDESAGDGAQRLLREAHAMARLSHSNVIPVYDAGTHEGSVFLAMEHVRGKDLAAWLAVPGRDWRDVLGAFLDAGRGLAAAHAAGIVHRDFKPSNVMAGDDGRVRVTDFGLANVAAAAGPVPSRDIATSTATTASRPPNRSADRPSHDAMTFGPDEKTVPPKDPGRMFLEAPSSSELTRPGTLLGTPAYMAPEQIRGGHVDGRTDQFAFCVALHEALFGRRPFAGETLGAVLGEIEAGRVQEPAPGSRAPARLRRILLRGLADRPEHRWETMDALVAELARDPARTARRTAAAIAVGLVPVALIGAVFLVSQRDRMACVADANREVALVWNAERARGLQVSIMGASQAGPGVWAHLEREVGSRVEGFHAGYREACSAAGGRPPAGKDDAPARRLACLDDRLRRVARAVDGFAREHKSIGNDPKSIAELPLPEDCARAETLAALPALPADPELRPQAEALADELARLQGMVDKLQPREALAGLTSTAASAESIGYAPLIATAQLNLARALGDTGDESGALAAAHRAAQAGERAGDVFLQGLALTKIAELHLKAGRTEDALLFERYAEACADAPGVAPRGRADIFENLGYVRLRVDDFDVAGRWEALPMLERALKIDEAGAALALSPPRDRMILAVLLRATKGDAARADALEASAREELSKSLRGKILLTDLEEWAAALPAAR